MDKDEDTVHNQSFSQSIYHQPAISDVSNQVLKESQLKVQQLEHQTKLQEMKYQLTSLQSSPQID